MRRQQETLNDFKYSETVDMMVPQFYAYPPIYSNIQPWLNKKYKKDIKKDTKLPKHHYELLRFSEWASPSKEERIMRQDVVARLTKIIKKIYPESKVKVYGSFESNLCVPQSDIDLSILNANIEPHMRPSALTTLAYEIHRSRLCDDAPSVITTTKVPIIKLVDSKSRYMVDINFECQDGLKNTKLIKHFLALYPLLRPLTIILKYFLKRRQLNDTWRGGISSYTLLILIMSFLQKHTKSHGLSKEFTEDENLATTLKNFLKFYGHDFDYKNLVISVLNGGSYLKKEEKGWKNENLPYALAVEDPQKPANDLGRASFNIESAKKSFQEGLVLFNATNIYLLNDSIVSKLIDVPREEIFLRNQIKLLYGNRQIKESDPKPLRPCNFTDIGLENMCDICNDDQEDEANEEWIDKKQETNNNDHKQFPEDGFIPKDNGIMYKNKYHYNPNKKIRKNYKNNKNHNYNNHKRENSKEKRYSHFDLSEQNFPSLGSVYTNKKENLNNDVIESNKK